MWLRFQANMFTLKRKFFTWLSVILSLHVIKLKTVRVVRFGLDRDKKILSKILFNLNHLKKHFKQYTLSSRLLIKNSVYIFLCFNVPILLSKTN